MKNLRFQCRCGKTELEGAGRPIVGTVCECTHCTAARRAFVRMGALPPSDCNNGTAAILYRNDRVRLLSGHDHLRQYRLAPESPTRRVIAECCNTPMFLDFEKGFWLSLYRDRTHVSDAAVERKTSNLRFMARLMQSFVSIGFRRPKVDPGLVALEERPLVVDDASTPA